MAGYVGLGARLLEAKADNTGQNPGNYTTVFTSAVLAVNVAWFEVYAAVAEYVPPGATARIYVGVYARSYAQFGPGGEWDPTQPVLLQPGQELYFYWSTATSLPGRPPKVTLWLRYDSNQWGRT